MSLSFLLSFLHRQLVSYPPRIPPTPSLAHKTIIITGANTGLGYSSASILLTLGTHHIILAVRSLSKGEAAAARLRTETRCPADAVEVWELDMGNYSSVIAFAERAKRLERLDACIANAGVMLAEFKRAASGHEETINTNVISTFLLAFLLHPILAASAARYQGDGPAYFSIVSSELYALAKFPERDAKEGEMFKAFDDEKMTGDLGDRYNVSKLLVNLMVRQMAGMAPLKLKGKRGGEGDDASGGDVVINCTAPGFCHSSLSTPVLTSAPAPVRLLFRLLTTLFARPTEVGARTVVYGALARLESHGQYVPDCKIMPSLGLGTGEEGKKLQERVCRELKGVLEGIREGVTVL